MGITNVITMIPPGGATNAIKIDLSRFREGVGLLCTLDFGAVASYSVEVSGDGTHWNLHDVLQNKTASANDSLAFPVALVRLNGTITGGNVTLCIIQGQ